MIDKAPFCQGCQIELEMRNEELRRVKDELENMRERYAELYDFAPIGYLSVNQKGFIDEANLTFASMLGVARGPLIGQPFTRFVLKDDQDTFYNHRRQLLETNAPRSCELRLLKEDGHAFYARLECTIITGKADLKEIRTAVSDITERKQMAEALQKRTHDLNERVKEFACLHDISEILMKQGDSLDDLLESLVDLIPSGWQYPEIACARIFYEGKAYRTENFTETVWRQAREMLAHGKPVGRVEVYYLELMPKADEGPFLRQEGVLIETIAKRLGRVVERHQAETALREKKRQLRRAQKMEAISTLAGGIAHDFNNILTAIIGYGQLAQMELDPESEAYADVKEVLQSGNRAKLLIQQILAVGRGQEQERRPMQFKFIVKEALKFLRSTLPSTIEIRETYDKDIGVIDGDPTQMHQVLMNLCTNAGHAMEQNGGILAVSLGNVDCGLRIAECENVEPSLRPGRYLELTVADTGYGMAPEIREKIFDPYFTTKKKGEGTGIGLSVVHGIVTQYGGAITVESEAGKGSTFHVYLPLAQGAEAPPEVKEETPLSKGDERILFVDDEAALARMGKKLLKALGYHVTAATSGTEALALFKDRPNQFDLVMTDTNMPNMPGDILARELMKIRPDIPVVICTGLSKRMSEEKAKEMGIKAFVMKPLSMRVLAEMVRRVLDESNATNRGFCTKLQQ